MNSKTRKGMTRKRWNCRSTLFGDGRDVWLEGVGNEDHDTWELTVASGASCR